MVLTISSLHSQPTFTTEFFILSNYSKMKYAVKLTFILMALSFSQCTTTKNTTQALKDKVSMESKTIMEVTTFNINSDVNSADFNARDAQVESDFTSTERC